MLQDIVDSVEFKNFCPTLSSVYHPPSATTLWETLIVDKAAHVCKLQLQYLHTCWNLTLTSDGAKIRCPQSVYTFHVTTAKQCTFLLDGDKSSLLSHTADYIVEWAESVS
jgi:hypothetical protein